MKSYFSSYVRLLLLVSGSFIPLWCHSSTIFEQDFTNTTGANTAINTAGWTGYSGNASTRTDINSGAVYLSNAQGDQRTNPSTELVYPSGYLNVARTGSAGVTPISVLYTTFSALDFSTAEISWITNTSANAGVFSLQLIVQSGDSWYASSQTFLPGNNRTSLQLSTDSTANLSAVLKSLTFDATASNWLTVNMSPSGLSLGLAPSTDISSSITGIGFYVVNSSGDNSNLRLDTLMVNAVPEPAALGLFAIGLLFLFFHSSRNSTRSQQS